MPKSTLSRLWRDEAWLDRAMGPTLQQLIAVLPGLGEYVMARSYAARLSDVLRACDAIGLAVRPDRIRTLAESCPIQYVTNVLAAAVAIMRLDTAGAFSQLARRWGDKQDIAIDALFDRSPNGLLDDPAPLTAQSVRLVELSDIRDNSMYSTVGHGILVHKLTKLNEMGAAEISSGCRDRRSAFTYRSAVIGRLLRAEDIAAADAYRAQVQDNDLLLRTELWSLASYSADVPVTPDFSLPPTILRGTAEDVMRDIFIRNNTYLHYLLTSAIPVLLRYDPSFGGKRLELVSAITDRIERGAYRRTESAGMVLARSVLHDC
ncbi:hypothetical protein ACIA8C_21495 [Nocardia sp. NPDC051321]|uniref:hypothetical protein n=1 Tax=Nocardia sp. NPDC051321 TaxID=3364323 RepID=UPI0037A5F59B